MLGAMMAGGNPAGGRQDDDFYPTPADVTEALLTVERFEGGIWEPCCGDGAMVKVLQVAGYLVDATDINPRGCGRQADFLETKSLAHGCENIVTNPPFELAVPMIEHALFGLGAKKLALVLKASFWHAKTRKKLWDRCPPAAIHPLLWRPDFLGKKRPTMEVMWCVWERGHTGPTHYRPLVRPG